MFLIPIRYRPAPKPFPLFDAIAEQCRDTAQIRKLLTGVELARKDRHVSTFLFCRLDNLVDSYLPVSVTGPLPTQIRIEDE